MKIYVGNLSYNINDEQLSAMFTQYGEVDTATVIIDRDTDRSKGFGFVEMSDLKQAQEAMNTLNGSEVDGRSITVNEARPREPRRDNNRGGSGGGRGRY